MHHSVYTSTTKAWTPKGVQVVTYEVILSTSEVELLAKKAASGSGKAKSGPVVVRILTRQAVTE